MLKHKKTSSKSESPRRLEPFPLDHVAIIMDGNRRWADQRGLPRLAGHKEGVKTLKELVKYAGANKLGYLTVYAFSSENWNRTKQEVDYLFELFASVVCDELGELHENNVRLTFIGQLAAIPSPLKKSFASAMELTGQNTGLSLQVAINYGSRLEITEAAKALAADVAAGKIQLKDIDSEMFSSYLYTSNIPDPDMIIRTGGEMRLSNYLLWQAAYAEIYVTPTLWPDFSPQCFEEAMAEFAARERRWGT